MLCERKCNQSSILQVEQKVAAEDEAAVTEEGDILKEMFPDQTATPTGIR